MRCGVAAMMWTVFRCETPRRNIFSTELPLAAASRHDLCAKWGEVLVPKRRNADVHQGFPRCRYVAGQLSWRNATSPAGALRRWRRMFRGRFGYWRNAPSLVPHGVRGTVAALRQNPGRARGAAGVVAWARGAMRLVWATVRGIRAQLAALASRTPQLFLEVRYAGTQPNWR